MNFEQREKAKRLAMLDERLSSNPFDASARASYKMLETARLYVVEFESANYYGAPSHCLVWAFGEDDAKMESDQYAEEYYYEEDIDQYLEENGDDEDATWSVTNSAVLLEGSKYAEYVEDENQQQAYYQVVN